MKSVPSRFKKNETVLRYQEVHKQLKDQYSRTRQMMEQAMEDGRSLKPGSFWSFRAIRWQVPL